MYKWVFGYGSLIIPEGINGRGMYYKYTEDDLHECTLKGFQRSWNALFKNYRFLGLIPAHESRTINGVIFGIHDEHDWQSFLKSESSYETETNPLYRLVDVTNQVKPLELVKLQHEKIFTCVTVSPVNDGTIPEYYKTFIAQAVKQRGPAFEQEFYHTTKFVGTI